MFESIVKPWPHGRASKAVPAVLCMFESIVKPWPHGRASKAVPADGSDGRPCAEGEFLHTYRTCRLCQSLTDVCR